MTSSVGKKPNGAGWWPDPTNLGEAERYFNGSQWTKDVRPVKRGELASSAAQSTAPKPTARKGGLRFSPVAEPPAAPAGPHGETALFTPVEQQAEKPTTPKPEAQAAAKKEEPKPATAGFKPVQKPASGFKPIKKEEPAPEEPKTEVGPEPKPAASVPEKKPASGFKPVSGFKPIKKEESAPEEPKAEVAAPANVWQKAKQEAGAAVEPVEKPKTQFAPGPGAGSGPVWEEGFAEGDEPVEVADEDFDESSDRRAAIAEKLGGIKKLKISTPTVTHSNKPWFIVAGIVVVLMALSFLFKPAMYDQNVTASSPQSSAAATQAAPTELVMASPSCNQFKDTLTVYAGKSNTGPLTAQDKKVLAAAISTKSVQGPIATAVRTSYRTNSLDALFAACVK